jgi:hypothetical protein
MCSDCKRMPYFPTDSIIVVWGYRFSRPNTTESQKLGIGTRSTKPVACHHLTVRHVHSNRGLREINPVYDLMSILFFGIKRGKAEIWPKIKVRSPLYIILHLYAVITTYRRAIFSIFLIISQECIFLVFDQVLPKAKVGFW